MKHLFIFILLFIHFNPIYTQSHNKESSTDKDEVRAFIDNRTKALSISAYDTSYFYKPNGELDTLKILSDTAFYWGGAFYYTNKPDDFIEYGQYILDSVSKRKKPIGKALRLMDRYFFEDVNGNRKKNTQWNRVIAIIYYDEKGNYIMGFSIDYESRKIVYVGREGK